MRRGGRKKPRDSRPIVIRSRDSRFRLERDLAEQALHRLLTPDPTGVTPNPRVLLIAAHPDDEAIGAGALLQDLPDATIVHVTDGAPAAEESARKRGFANREAYAAARRAEVISALKLVGIAEEQVRCLGFVDGEATFRMVELAHKVIDLMLELDPEIILTHPYEGGHTDHDACAFAVHLACGILRREGLEAPVVLEFTSYHNRGGKRIRAQFLPFWKVPERALELPVESQLVKARMFKKFTSQADCLKAFPVHVERFRMAPRYNFELPPHAGQLDYEKFCSSICGDEWRSRAEAALDLLRSRRRVGQG